MRPRDRDLSFRLRVLWACGMLPGNAKRISTNKILGSHHPCTSNAESNSDKDRQDDGVTKQTTCVLSVGKGKYILGSVTGVKCHDLLGAYCTSKPHVAQIIKGRCVRSQHTFALPSQLACLRGTRDESQNSSERNPCNGPHRTQ